MSIFNFEQSLARAEARLAADPSARRQRSDKGRLRLDSRLVRRLRELLLTQEKPAMREVRLSLARWAKTHRLRPPSRATLYNTLARIPGHRYRVADLPPAAAAALYNLDQETEVPGFQLAFACFNCGGTPAMSFAAGLPWLDLYQADLMRGWRPKSRGLLRAVRHVRRI